MKIKAIIGAAAFAGLVAWGSSAWAQDIIYGEGAAPVRPHASKAVDPQSLLCGLFLSGSWQFTLAPEYPGGPRADVFGPASPNDLRINNTFSSCYSQTGTLRLEYWIATNGNQPLSQGGPFVGTRIAIFPNNGQLFAGQSFINVNGFAPYTIPAYGQYWLVLRLAQYQLATCGDVDNFCYSDSYTSSQMITIGNNTLTVSKNGTGTGLVTGIVNRTSATAISCGGTCQASLYGGESVTLSASPNTGSTFAGWSGGGCSGTGTCTVSMAFAQSVAATFNVAAPVTYSLSVSKSGNGTVTSTPAGINCGATCVATYNSGTPVSLTATPAIGYNFSGWTLACAGTGNCNLTMNGNQSVTALFSPLPVIPTTSRARTDFNNDKKSDILYRNTSTGQLYRMLMNGITITGATMAYTEPNLAWKVVQDADFNFDGSADLLWRNTATGQVYMQPFNASGLPNPGTIVANEPNPAWKIVQAVDLDGDLKSDILWYNTATGQVYAMLMNGTSIVSQGFVYTEPNLAWKIVGVGDFAASGKKNQILWRNDATGQIYLMTVTVTGGVFSQTGSIIYTEPNLAWKVIGVPDLNADGKSDILWRNDITGQVYGHLMDGATIASQGMIHTEPNLAWKIVAHGDYSGDGAADLLWRNEATGQLHMMYMNGIAIVAQAAIYTEPNLAWKVLGPYEYAQ